MNKEAFLRDLEALAAKFDEMGDEEVGDAYSGPYYECARQLRALLIDGQTFPASSIAQRKLRELQDEGFIVNGVAIFNPTTGRRGLVDYLGYVGWQTSEQPAGS